MKIEGLSVYHLTAKIERPDVSLVEFEVAGWVWERLRAAFPFALAACLMPDHPHVVTPLEDALAGQMRLNRLLGQLARRLEVRHVGMAAAPSLIADREKLLRHVRYVSLNPPRARLVDDPLEWLFSTHRDIVGATVDPWMDAPRLAAALARPREGFVPWYHRYVSADPSVNVAGTPVPRPAEPSDIPSFSLATIARAVAAATRSRPDAIRRTGHERSLFIALARAHGWRDTSMLANACACGPRAIQRAALHDIDLTAAALCLGDTRLLEAAPSWRR